MAGQACAAGAIGTRQRIEALKQAILGKRRNAGAAITHAQRQHALAARTAQLYAGTVRREIDRVVDQVVERLAQQQRVAGNLDVIDVDRS